MMHGEYGVDDVCLSTLNLVGKRGIQQKIISPLTEEETAKLHASATKLKEIIAGLDI
jgi:L-lactate dehydrogenase